MKKMVLSLDLHDNKTKKKAMKTVSTLSGIDSISMDMKEKKLTVIGTVDPFILVTKLRKHWPTTNFVLVEEVKPPEKKDDAGAKKEEPKKDGAGNEQKKEEGKKEGEKKAVAAVPAYYDPVMLEMLKNYRPYHYPYNHYPTPYNYYHVHNTEENPSSCTIG